MNHPGSENTSGRQVGFLFNHDQVHQVAHSAPVAFELSRMFPQFQVTLIAGSRAEFTVLEAIGKRFPGHHCILRRLKTSRGLTALAAAFDGLAPLRKVAILRANRALFRQFEALVVPEKTSLLLRSRFGLSAIKMIHTRHGAGDRAVGFDAHSGEFDFVLLAGEKIRQRLSAASQLREGRYAIVGYPKFDAVNAFEEEPPPLFDNDRLTVVYNPHFSPHLSSWYSMGRDILEFFYRSHEYNLIVAPHVMLFRRRMQISIDRLSLAFARGIPRKYRKCNHILIDTGSPACTDMTYTKAADLYLGDVSSQICEFLVRPRPCLFANAHGVHWQNDPNYAAWHLGPVCESTADLGAQLKLAFDTHEQYRPLQEAYFRETFDLADTPSAQRAAAAVAEFLDRD